jgi:uncharacterized damage-inducible protein DinB
MTPQIATLMAEYNRWMNERLYEAAATLDGETLAADRGALLQHFFNHQTHHRGQVSTLLFQAGVDVGVTDLLAVIPRSDA